MHSLSKLALCTCVLFSSQAFSQASITSEQMKPIQSWVVKVFRGQLSIDGMPRTNGKSLPVQTFNEISGSWYETYDRYWKSADFNASNCVYEISKILDSIPKRYVEASYFEYTKTRDQGRIDYLKSTLSGTSSQIRADQACSVSGVNNPSLAFHYDLMQQYLASIEEIANSAPDIVKSEIDKERIAAEKARQARLEQERIARTQREKQQAAQREQERLAKIERDKQEAEQRERNRLAEVERNSQIAEQRERDRLAEVQRDRQLAEQREQDRIAEVQRNRRIAEQREHDSVALIERDKWIAEQKRLAKIQADKNLATQKELARLAKIEEEQREEARHKAAQRKAFLSSAIIPTLMFLFSWTGGSIYAQRKMLKQMREKDYKGLDGWTGFHRRLQKYQDLELDENQMTRSIRIYSIFAHGLAVAFVGLLAWIFILDPILSWIYPKLIWFFSNILEILGIIIMSIIFIVLVIMFPRQMAILGIIAFIGHLLSGRRK